MKLDQAPAVGPITVDRRLLLDCARAIQEAIGMEEGLDSGAGEAVLERIQFALGLSDDAMSEATGPWIMGDEFCPACAPDPDAPSRQVPGVVCSACNGLGRQIIGLGGPY